jgi:signal transduction histidine kinase
MIAPHALSYPGLITDMGLLGGNPQTTAWIYMFWHGGFPLCAILYTTIPEKPISEQRGGALSTILQTISATVCVALLTTKLLVAHIDDLPQILQDNVYTPAMKYVVGSVWGVGIIAMLMLWFKKARSALDLWLIVVMLAWLFDVALSAVFNHGRYDLGFYAGRIYGLIAAGFVLVMLIIDTSRLNERLVTATSQLVDYTDTLETRVRERTEELTRIERQLAQSQKMEALGHLTGGIAHDFNNLLNVIIGNLDVLCETSHGTNTDELLQDVLNAALRGRDMTRRLLAFARRQPLQPQRTEVNALIDNVFSLLERTLGRNITVSFNLANDLWSVAIDPGQLEDAITNLTTNARDAMPHGGTITVSTQNRKIDDQLDLAPGDYVTIEFSDTGTGIPQTAIEHIFEPFFTTKEAGKGTGLGLSMVFGFLKQSGGHIAVRSNDQGTTFTLYLPRFYP